MLDSAKDVAIEGSKFLDIVGDYVHHEHHYPNSEIVIYLLGSVGTSGLERSYPKSYRKSNFISMIMGPWRETERPTTHRTTSIASYGPTDHTKDEDPFAYVERRVQETRESQAKVPQSPSAAERKQTGHRKPFMWPPTKGFHSTGEMRRTAHGIPPPSNVIYSTDPANAKHSNDHEPDADKEEAEHPPEPDNIPLPLNSYTSPDFDVYDELYQNPPDADTDWESHPDPDPYFDESNFEEPPTSLPPLPPLEVDVEYWHAWYAHCVSSWQASMAAWTAALISWTPPWLGMCGPSWLGAWAPWR